MSKIKIIPVLLSCVLLITGCGEKSVVNKETIKNVKPTVVGTSSITVQQEFAGQIAGIDQVGVVPKVPGKVSAVYVDVGTRVKKGDLLFSLDSSDAYYQLQQAQAGEQVAKVNLDRASGSSFSQALIQAQSAYDQAKIAYDDAKTSYDKLKLLFDQSALSKRELEASENRMNLTKQQMDAAQKNIELLKNGVGPDSTKLAEAQLSQTSASIQLIQSQIDNSRVTAPISGIIARKNINIGEGVSAASPSFVIVNTDQLVAEVSISEKMISKVKLGQKLSVKVESIADTIFEGEVTNISPLADARTHSYTVKIKLLNKENQIKPGMFAKITLDVESKNNIISIPNESVITENSLQFVYLIENNSVAKRQIKTGLSNDKETEVLEGIKVGDMLITEGQNFLNEGQKVNIVK